MLFQILERGFFPRELPPVFQSTLLAEVVHANFEDLPEGFVQGKVSKLSVHSTPRIGLKRRLMAYPNPVSYVALCYEIEQNWQTLQNHFSQSCLSLSTPTISLEEKDRAIRPRFLHKDLPKFRMKIRKKARFILQTDIAQFYPSIYSHSIPWALHTKATAKKDSSLGLFGNRIDRLLRYGQDRQTIGIPIGPDTSLIIAEIILSAVDKALATYCPVKLNGFRFVDDYEFGVPTAAQAEEILSALQKALQDYELGINFAKTKIRALPVPIDSTWTSQLRNFQFKKDSESNLLEYFNLAFDLASSFPDDSVLKYAVVRLHSFEVSEAHWQQVQNFLFQCAMNESGTLKAVIELLIKRYSEDYPIDKVTLREVLNYQICTKARTRCTHEIAWAIWALIYWGQPVEAESVAALTGIESSTVALLVLHARELGLLCADIDVAPWEAALTADGLYGPLWMLSYEANVKKWLDSETGTDHIENDENFEFLRRHNVEFFKIEAVPYNKPSGEEIEDEVMKAFYFTDDTDDFDLYGF